MITTMNLKSKELVAFIHCVWITDWMTKLSVFLEILKKNLLEIKIKI